MVNEPGGSRIPKREFASSENATPRDPSHGLPRLRSHRRQYPTRTALAFLEGPVCRGTFMWMLIGPPFLALRKRAGSDGGEERPVGSSRGEQRADSVVG